MSDIINSLCDDSQDQVETGSDSDLLSDLQIDVDVVSDDEIEEGLDGVNTVDIHPSLLRDCPIYACIWSKLINGQLSSDFFCNLLAEFEGPSSTGHLTIGARNIREAPGATGAAQLTPSGNVAITINSNNCNDEEENVFAAYETFQHELLHAKIINSLQNYGYDGTLGTIEEAFFKMVNIRYGEDPTQAQHQFMLDFFLDQMVNSLVEINGSGEYSDFLGLVLSGFPDSVLTASGFDLDDRDEIVEHSRVFLKDESNINSQLLECGDAD